ncbi:hypothetical protein CONCODRAFT_7725 [Conidiobolus coronatus NRRL 28638]|uniref:G-protein coupled receptors family 1 profile domain-containing protein n=1 Tax=Conidiobolus coronatus (strain ATCC 28846 / CBS 209.66 / NRRL 28638) TaxID=796925 RepID=A0A137P431_CONC2|nr:hypothetical protein CONCODRAFT_7725 [Conidiobolus coronatus NRRL 28638]|eukprot:KXN69777.1 hypothetical protein CONCODRAFT_7725 [Conidiobolus coronatus NRRL 28638]
MSNNSTSTSTERSTMDLPDGFAEHRSILPSILAVNCMIMGALGCLITLMILIFLIKRKWSTFNIDIKIAFLVLILDFLGSLGTFLVGICSMTPFNLWIAYKWLCDLNAFFLVGFFYASNYMVALMSFQRYLLICHKKILPNWTWYFLAGLIIILCVGNICLLIGFNLVELMPLTIYCLTSPTTAIGYAAVIIYCSLGTLSWVTIVYCYTTISIYRRLEDAKLAKTMNLELNTIIARSNKLRSLQYDM